MLERHELHHSPISVASSPAPPEPMAGTRDRPMLVDESPAPHYITVEDSPAPQFIAVEESPVPMSGVKNRPCLVVESPEPTEDRAGTTSPVPISGTKDRPSLVDDSPAMPKVNNLCWGGGNQVEGGSATLCKTLEKNPSVVFLLCADLNIGCSKTKSSNDNPRHTARQINSTSVLISITVHSTEIVTIPKHTKTMYIAGIHNSCMSQHNYIPTKSDVFIIKQSFIKANSVHKSVRAHALQCPKRRHLHCNAKQHNIWVYVTYMCQYSQVLSTIP